ncbi:MAG: imidazole glycerol phosphate synthase subunit HisH [Candidatus Sumerlaeota bacterium]|nr:imidazole glycerol phosphate synthase subunit HisH [Candidatus Sumerlaeota bacterium]
MIAIVDYGMGNLRSVEKALQRLGFDARISSDPRAIERAERVVLPGVGAFGDGIEGLRSRGLIDVVKEAARSGRPFLGICVGLQLLFDSSEESPGAPGLGVIAGEVRRFRVNLKVPHMGWNKLEVRPGSRLLGALPPEPYVYFVHSYAVYPDDAGVVAAEAEYGGRFTAAIERGNLFATQFHPEKSQSVGLGILKTFGELG